MSDQFFQAVEDGDISTVQMMLTEQPELATARENDDQALHIAAKHNWPEIVTTLLDAGADIDAEGEQRRTPLHCAAHISYKAAEVLVARHVQLNKVDAEGNTPLLLALAGQTVEGERVAELLLQRGAQYGIMEATCRGDLASVLNLLDQHPDAVRRIESTERLLIVATCIGHPGNTADRATILELLFKNGFQPSRKMVDAVLIQPIPEALKVILRRQRMVT